MSIPVNLINCRNSLLLTQQKLSKSVDSRNKSRNEFNEHLTYERESVSKSMCELTRGFCGITLPKFLSGPEEDRTPDPLLAKQVLSQLSYRPC